MADVFVNYRTGDGDKSAVLIERELSHRFGKDTAFRASASIKPGRRYPEALLSGVRRSAVLLAVIGPEWARWPSLHEEGDWVRREIVEAFSCGIPVLPVLEGRTTERLRAADLPAELAEIAEIQSTRLDLHQAESDLIRIGDALVELVPSLLEAERSAAGDEAAGAVHNTMGEVHGTAVQSRDITGDVGTVIKGSQGPVHTGRGNLYHQSPHFSGDGATFVAGDNHGGIGHRFGEPRRPEDGGR
ncbi:TIR domain-containing protein [Streptacidiphilus griseoplanus]|uniref:TIR domain-containing protein n=1 Tax=Peterkaempfera griseoplana TaxID=66896 RepID=UPI0006E28873|nr:TIR domain-containing protein [Peterkaempfera griseoplana]